MLRVKGMARVVCASACLMLATSCAQQMGSQPNYRPLKQSAFFRDGQSARGVVPGTVPSGYTRTNARLEMATVVDPDAASLPFSVTEDVLMRGRERFNIYCAVCHGQTGDGDGMIVSRGFSHPPSFHTDTLRAAQVGHFYDVMTNGFGAMSSYAAQVNENDRWAITAYIRALQLSQRATLDDVPAENRPQLENGGESR